MQRIKSEIDAPLFAMSLVSGVVVWITAVVLFRGIPAEAQVIFFVLFLAWGGIWIYHLMRRGWAKPNKAPFWMKLLQLAMITPVTGAMIGFLLAKATH